MSDCHPFTYDRGHRIDLIDGKWLYTDGREWDESRPCPRCGLMPTPEGHDACLGHIPGMHSVCCGHGVHRPIFKSPIPLWGPIVWLWYAVKRWLDGDPVWRCEDW